MRGAAGGNVADDTGVQAKQQTVALRKMLQNWGAQSEQIVGMTMAQPPPTESPSIFGPPQQQQQEDQEQQAAALDPSAVGADDVDASSFGF